MSFKTTRNWVVNQDYIKGQLVYFVENLITGERCGEFDWQARAQEFANQLNAGDIRVSQISNGHFGRKETI